MDVKYWKRRDEIIFGEADLSKYGGGIRRFRGLSLDQLTQLLQLHYISPVEHHNCAPSTQEIWNFMSKYPGYTALGYVVSPHREDCRVTLDGIEKSTAIVDADELAELHKIFINADEYIINHTRIWYD